jgi:hypothetical protein
MTTAKRIALALAACSFLALSGFFASAVVTHKRTVPAEAGYWRAAGCDEVCLHRKWLDETPRVSVDFSEIFR